MQLVIRLNHRGKYSTSISEVQVFFAGGGAKLRLAEEKKYARCVFALDTTLLPCYNCKAGYTGRDGRAVDGAGLENQ